MNLQKELFLESMQLMDKPGWEILEEEDLLAFKSPAQVSFIEFVYGNVTARSYEKVKSFFRTKSYLWLLSENQKDDLLIQLGFGTPHLTYEMGINLSEYKHSPISEPVQVREVRSSKDHSIWLDVAGKWLNVSASLVDQFFSPWIDAGKFIPFIGFYEDMPAATSLVYCGKRGAALYMIGTLTDFRNRGLGTAVTNACLKVAKEKGIDQAVLYGSKMGKSVYEKIGFQLTQTIREFECPKS